MNNNQLFPFPFQLSEIDERALSTEAWPTQTSISNQDEIKTAKVTHINKHPSLAMQTEISLCIPCVMEVFFIYFEVIDYYVGVIST